jgi:hypothetical protein
VNALFLFSCLFSEEVAPAERDSQIRSIFVIYALVRFVYYIDKV